MTQLGRTLRDVLAKLPRGQGFALVGGLAVSARTEPRFTRDLDLAVSVSDDPDAERVVFELQRHGYVVVATIEHATRHRLATVRLRQGERAPLVDLLFASSGIEPEVVSSASQLELLGVRTAVATVGHLIAMKLVSRDPRLRPRDQQDLVELASVADETEWSRAAAAIDLIEQRGFSRGRDLSAGLEELRLLARSREP